MSNDITENKSLYYGIDDNGIFTESHFCNIDGVPVERTPYSHPYSYDEYVIYKDESYDKTDDWVYSDRLLQWNRTIFVNAVKAVWPGKSSSQMFYDKKPEDLNKFLSLYFGKKVKLTAVMQGCNISSGYPYWIFAYKEET